MSDLSVACLAIIFMGLIVLWSGYVKRHRSAWLVMFIIVWLWAFPLGGCFLFVSALAHNNIALTSSETLYDAIAGRGSPRSAVASILIFSLMMIGLLLPMSSILWPQGSGTTDSSAIGQSRRVFRDRPFGRYDGDGIDTNAAESGEVAVFVGDQVDDFAIGRDSSAKAARPGVRRKQLFASRFAVDQVKVVIATAGETADDNIAIVAADAFDTADTLEFGDHIERPADRIDEVGVHGFG